MLVLNTGKVMNVNSCKDQEKLKQEKYSVFPKLKFEKTPLQAEG